VFDVILQDMWWQSHLEISTTEDLGAWIVDTSEAEDRQFFVDSINKAIRDAMQEHNTTLLDAFDNTMKEVFHG
jgi:hypothetical protein